MTVKQSKHVELVATEVLGNVRDLLLVPSQRWRMRQQWSSWQVEEEKYQARLRQESVDASFD